MTVIKAEHGLPDRNAGAFSQKVENKLISHLLKVQQVHHVMLHYVRAFASITGIRNMRHRFSNLLCGMLQTMRGMGSTKPSRKAESGGKEL